MIKHCHLASVTSSGPFIPTDVHELSCVNASPILMPGLQRRAATELITDVDDPLITMFWMSPLMEHSPLVDRSESRAVGL